MENLLISIILFLFIISLTNAQRNEEISSSTPESESTNFPTIYPPGLEPQCLNESLVKIKFDLHFMCGKYRGAEGRLFIRMRRAVAGEVKFW